jgi:precorrin-2 dehydrogenase / sirohydrochlorin ferrochelatase
MRWKLEHIMNALFPIFVKLEGRGILVVGAGRVGEQKILGLLATGAHIRVVAPKATGVIRAWKRRGQIKLQARKFRVSDLKNVFLAIAATSSRELNEQIYQEAHRHSTLCNVVDVPELCDFYYPAVVQRGDLQIAISTSGQSPSLASQMRKQLERQFGADFADRTAKLGATRRQILSSNLTSEEKRNVLALLASRELHATHNTMASRDTRSARL